MLAGVIPIDRLTDVRSPAAVIAAQVSRQLLQAAYNITLPKPQDDPHRWEPAHSASRTAACLPVKTFESMLADQCQPAPCCVIVLPHSVSQHTWHAWQVCRSSTISIHAHTKSTPALDAHATTCSRMSPYHTERCIQHAPSVCRAPTAAELLRAVALARGWVVQQALPDEQRAGRLLLHDFCSGKLPHWELPPGQPEAAGPATAEQATKASEAAQEAETASDSVTSTSAQAHEKAQHAGGESGLSIPRLVQTCLLLLLCKQPGSSTVCPAAGLVQQVLRVCPCSS